MDGDAPERPELRGGSVLLRAPRPADRADRLAAGLHPDFLTGLARDPDGVLTEAEVDAWYERISSEPLHWIVEVDDRAVGATALRGLRPRERHARFSIALFDTSVWGRGIGTTVTRLVLWYAFEHLTLHRVELSVLAGNKRAIRVYERCGFRREGRERESAIVSGVWQDDIIMGILENEYRAAANSWPELPSLQVVPK